MINFSLIFIAIFLICSSINKAEEIISLNEADQNNFIGDNLHVEVFDFIIQELLKAKTLSLQEVKKIAGEEEKIFNSLESLKSYEACAAEGPFSYLLNVLCSYKKNCHLICIYKRDGLAIGLTSLQNDYEKIRPKESYAVLSDMPLSKIGIKKINTMGNENYYEVVQAIYIKDNIASLSFKKIEDEGQKLLGFVKYIYSKKNE